MRALRARLVALDQVSSRIANLRVVAFAAAAGFAGFTAFSKLPSWGWGAAAFSLLVFFALATWHDRVVRAERVTGARLELNLRGEQRLAGTWRAFAQRGDGHLSAEHLYAADLDVFGQGSLFQLLDETATRQGEAHLASYLAAPAPADVVRERQGAVRELSNKLDFRQTLVAHVRVAVSEKADAARFIDWAEGPSALAPVAWAKPLPFVLPPLTLAVYLLGEAGALHPSLFWLGLLAQLGVLGLTRKATAGAYERMSLGEAGFSRFAASFRALEQEPFHHGLLTALQSGLERGAERVSSRFRRFGLLYSFAELKQAGQLHALINLLLLWDLLWLFRLERWRSVHGRQVRGWFDALAELEALSSLAGYAHDHPTHAWPELSTDGPPFVWARALGHPLLDAPVRNDVALGPGAPRAYVITGSNMSGKTTLLRAVGLNTVMAQAGLPVSAEAMRLSDLRVITSMRVKDSLERGVSYFYAEVQRIKAVLDAAKNANGRALFLVDELLLGTNAAERQIASREVLRLLLSLGAIGAVTTHDLKLAELSGSDYPIRPVHFTDQLVDGQMRFDYRMREGVATSTNALRVLQQAGVPIVET